MRSNTTKLGFKIIVVFFFKPDLQKRQAGGELTD